MLNEEWLKEICQYEPRIKVLKYYPYRKGFVRGDLVLQFPITPMRDFQQLLAHIAGVKCDNHTCFLVEIKTISNNKIVAFMFSDLTMYMGDRVEEKSW
jgi:hypothetical protein